MKNKPVTVPGYYYTFSGIDEWTLVLFLAFAIQHDLGIANVVKYKGNRVFPVLYQVKWHAFGNQEQAFDLGVKWRKELEGGVRKSCDPFAMLLAEEQVKDYTELPISENPYKPDK